MQNDTIVKVNKTFREKLNVTNHLGLCGFFFILYWNTSKLPLHRLSYGTVTEAGEEMKENGEKQLQHYYNDPLFFF